MIKDLLTKKPYDIKKIPSFQSIALFTFFALYGPIIILIVYSFNSSPSLGMFESFSFKWYVTAWNNEKVQEAAIRSLVLAAIAASIATVAATMAALPQPEQKSLKELHLYT